MEFIKNLKMNKSLIDKEKVKNVLKIVALKIKKGTRISGFPEAINKKN